ncbi:MAG: hypothetical protein IPL31_04965 [Saprospiraceae bacterium]|nr:hypothetical protein [Saprospiraceae bacterium]
MVNISLLLVGLFVITKDYPSIFGNHFYETLNQIEKFEIDKSNHPKFAETNIEEFDRLNNSIEKLITKNTSIYHSQENLLKMQLTNCKRLRKSTSGKIDTLIQNADFTQEQYKTLEFFER